MTNISKLNTVVITSRPLTLCREKIRLRREAERVFEEETSIFGAEGGMRVKVAIHCCE